MKKQRLGFMFFSIALLLCCSAALSWAFTLPDTGQTKCYDTAGAVISCTGSGQDGAYSINPMSFTDNGNGTITDNVTGLMWQKDENAAIGYDWYQASGTYNASYNSLSQNVCGSLTLGGQSGWRLPTRKELMSIVDYGTSPGATINTTYFPNTHAIGYWSSTSYAAATSNAWIVGFGDGSVAYGNKSYNPITYIRCVRGGQSSPSFTDNGNGTVTDNRTGLMWQQQGEPLSKTWAEALTYCEGLSLGGQTDWRLPNIKELESITDDAKYNPTIDTTYFPNTPAGSYWSSTSSATGANYTNYAWLVDFSGGLVYVNFNKSNFYDVRCVRGGQSGSLGTFVLSSTSQTLTSTSGTASITVTGSGAWTATSSLSWVTITSGASGTGNGTVVISVAANTTGAARTGNITIAGQTFTITQSAAGGSSVSLVTSTTQTSYSTIQAAYDANTAATGSTIKVQGTTLTENLVFNQNNSITLAGGYDSSFSAIGATMTTVQGSLTISGGAVTVANIVIQ